MRTQTIGRLIRDVIFLLLTQVAASEDAIANNSNSSMKPTSQHLSVISLSSILSNMMKEYDKMTIPLGEQEEALNVGVGLYISDMVPLEILNMVCHFCVYFF